MHIFELFYKPFHISTGNVTSNRGSMSSKVLTLAFLRPAQDDPWVNRLTAMASAHGFCHVELVFDSHLNSKVVSAPCFSIYAGGTANIHRKAFSNPNYEFISLLVSPQQYETCFSFCNDVSKSNMTFDERGMWFSQFHPGCYHVDSISVGATFCSKIITEALKIAHVQGVDHLCPSAVTPSRLYNTLYQQETRTSSVIRMRGAYSSLDTNMR